MTRCGFQPLIWRKVQKLLETRDLEEAGEGGFPNIFCESIDVRIGNFSDLFQSRKRRQIFSTWDFFTESDW